MSSIAPMECYVLGFWLAGRGTHHRRHGNTDQYQGVLESGRFGALTFCPCLDVSSIAPMERYVLAFGLQGGGVYIQSNGEANFESCNIHDNTATSVCLHL